VQVALTPLLAGRRARPDYYLPFSWHRDDELDSVWRYCAAAVGIDPG
jgi:dehydrogenase/reductase SDR family member 12